MAAQRSVKRRGRLDVLRRQLSELEVGAGAGKAVAIEECPQAGGILPVGAELAGEFDTLESHVRDLVQYPVEVPAEIVLDRP
ncbi:hypothetical protein [Duganella sp. SG902]|uniref:hypothetical protein n=1 Tax=Duganella sp. SG902 TaxID=2587016 RepID=UPI00159E8445